MDPRTKGYDPNYANKRPQSRSPEAGGPPHKVPRTNTGPVPRKSTAPSRRPSVSTTSVRSPVNDPRRQPTTQLQSELKANADTFMVSSPDSMTSRRSQYEDAPSGRSTPMSAHGMVPPKIPGPPPPPPLPDALANVSLGQETHLDLAMSEADKSMYQKLIGVFDHMITVSQSVSLRDKAKANFNQATFEYNALSKNFPDFPVIKQLKTTAKNDAEAALEESEKMVAAGKDAQQRLIEELTTALGQITSDAHAAKPAEIDTADFVPRSDFVALEKQFDSHVESSEKRMNELLERSEDLTNKLEQLGEGRIKQLETSTASTKERVDKVEKQGTSNEERVLKVEKQAVSSEERVRKFEKQIASSDDHVNEVARESKLTKAQFDTVKATVKSAQDKVSAIDIKVAETREELRKSLDDSRKTRHDKLYQEGQELVENVKEITAKIKVLEKTAQTGFTGKRVSPAEPTNASSAVDLEPFNTRLAQLEHDMYDKEGNVAERDTILTELITEIDGHVRAMVECRPQDEQHFNALRQDVDGFTNAMSSHKTSTEQAIKTLRQNVNDEMKDIGAQLAQKATNQSVDEIKKDAKTQLATKAEAREVTGAIDDIKSQLREKISQSILDDAMRRVKDGQLEYGEGAAAAHEMLTSLDNRIDKLEKRKDSSAALSQGKQPSDAFSTMASTNGTSTRSSDPSASINSRAQTNGGLVQKPNGGPVTHFLDVDQAIEEMKAKQEVLTIATHSLEDRYNNLTTDVVVQAMVDEMSKMYPNAKSFQNTVVGIARKLNDMDQRLGKLDNDVSVVAQIATDDKRQAGEVAKTVDGIKSAVEKLKEEMQVLQKQPGAQYLGGGAQDDSEQFQIIHRLQTTTAEMDERIRGLDKALSKMTERASEVPDTSSTTEVDRISTRMDATESTVKNVLEVVRETKTSQVTMQTKMGKLPSAATAEQHKALQLELAKAVKTLTNTQADCQADVAVLNLEWETAKMAASKLSEKVDKHEQRLRDGETSIAKVGDLTAVMNKQLVAHESRISALEAACD